MAANSPVQLRARGWNPCARETDANSPQNQRALEPWHAPDQGATQPRSSRPCPTKELRGSQRTTARYGTADSCHTISKHVTLPVNCMHNFMFLRIIQILLS